MRRVLLILGALFAVCIIIAAIGGVLAFTLTQEVANMSENFMKAIQEERFDDAYALFTAALQEDVSPEEFAATFESWEIDSWNFTNRNINNNLGSVEGTALINGSNYFVTFGFVNVDGKWLMNSYNFVEAEE